MKPGCAQCGEEKRHPAHVAGVYGGGHKFKPRTALYELDAAVENICKVGRGERPVINSDGTTMSTQAKARVVETKLDDLGVTQTITLEAPMVNLQAGDTITYTTKFAVT